MLTTTHCPDCGATLNPGTTLCPACLLSAGSPTEPIHPLTAGVPTLPCQLGDYQLLRKLGEGGMGIVYEAMHLPSARRLALKVLSHGLEGAADRERFLREGRLAASIDHPHSIYVFGTEEIEGIPVIAMELAAGGTLRDEVKRLGPLPARRAVDAILEVIAGLEAAHACGILHRDIKPSNCFVTTDGGVKVGDYGLSISRIDESHLTRSGLVLGTPAFSPPEQLRGQALDQRADIYSVGGTLYFLLTGKAPIEAGSSVEAVAAVLEGRVPPVASLNPSIPTDLAAIIHRCLASAAASRFANYAELRLALLPFGSTAPEPAPLGMRLVAGFIDSLTISLVGFATLIISGNYKLAQAMLDEEKLDALSSFFPLWTLGLPLYTAFCEARWSGTPGKLLCGLQVIGLEGARPSWKQALARAALWFGWGFVISQLLVLVDETGSLKAGTPTPPNWQRLGLEFFIMSLLSNAWLLLFIPALRRSDRAAAHDLLSRTRLILRRRGPERLRVANALPAVTEQPNEPWSPYHAGSAITDDLRCGYDPVLRRPVLLQRRTAADSSPTAQRRDCARAGRLHWLQAITDPTGQVWDAWQAPAGSPLPEVLRRHEVSWSQMLFWLADIALELDAAEKDSTLPATLSLEQIWITCDGRAQLLDEPWASTPPRRTFATGDARATQHFLHHLGEQCPSTQRPLHADALMKGLRAATFDRLSHIIGNTSHLQAKKMQVSRLARFATTLGPWIAYAVTALSGMWIAQKHLANVWTTKHPGLPPLNEVLRMQANEVTHEYDFTANVALSKHIRTHIRGHYRELYEKETGPAIGPKPPFYLSENERDMLKGLLASEVRYDAARLQEAETAVQKAISQAKREGSKLIQVGRPLTEWTQKYPGQPALPEVVWFYHRSRSAAYSKQGNFTPEDNTFSLNFRIYLHAHYKDYLAHEVIAPVPPKLTASLSREQRLYLATCCGGNPYPIDATQLAAADQAVRQALAKAAPTPATTSSADPAPWQHHYPDLPALPTVLTLGTSNQAEYQQHQKAQQQRQANPIYTSDSALSRSIRTHIAGHYQALKDDQGVKMGNPAPPYFLPIRESKALRAILATEPIPQAEALAQADSAVRAALPSFLAKQSQRISMVKPSQFAAYSAAGSAIFISALQFIIILITGRPLLMRLIGAVVVTAHQRPASRLRMLGRWCIGWSPLLLGIATVLLLKPLPTNTPEAQTMLFHLLLTWLVIHCALVILALLLPRRSLLDRLAGTWIVPA